MSDKPVLLDRVVVTSGLADVIASGTVIAFDRSSPTFITLGHRPQNIQLVFAFRDDPTRPLSHIEVDTEPRTIGEIAGLPPPVRFTLFNFNEPTGSGPEQPIKLGKSGDLSIYIAFRVVATRESPKVFHYTLYLRDDARAARIQREAIVGALSRER